MDPSSESVSAATDANGAALKLHNLNLNLLVTLNELLSLKNVSAVARALGLTQPTVSASLAKLRAHFDDALLVRRGNRLALTTIGAQLVEPVQHAVVAVSHVFVRRPEHVDPGALRRVFRIIGSDYATICAIAPAVARVAELAPGVRVEVASVTPADVAGLEERLRTVDAIVMPRGIFSGFPHTDLFEDAWVALADQHSPLGTVASIRDLEAADWIVTYGDSDAFLPVIRQLSLLGVRPKTVATAPSFVEAAAFVRGTDRIAAIQSRLAASLATAWGLRVIALPIDPVPIVQTLWWHPVHERDAEHRWFRSIFAEGAETVEV